MSQSRAVMESVGDAREQLVRDVKAGTTTLVLGAGVAGACKVATWRELAQRLWQEAFGTELPEVADDSRFYPFALEHVQAAMGPDFEARLKAALYRGYQPPTRAELLESRTNSLAVIARLVAREAASPARRIARIITLNVDDLLERAVRLISDGRASPVQAVVRGSLTFPRPPATAPLPVYHLHGYLKSPGAPELGAPHDEVQEAADVLVFTDLQYWASAAIPSSHMNRTFSFALHDSHCVFIGTSMLDLNIWRWLALRAYEVSADCRSQCEQQSSREGEELYQKLLHRHYWVTASHEDAFLSKSLALRGVRAVGISGWRDESLQDLISECFGD